MLEDVEDEDIDIEAEDEAEEEERENSTVSPLSPISSHRDISAVRSLVTRPSALVLEELLEGRGSCQLASISTTPSPAISKDTRNPAATLSKSKSMLLLLETLESACRKVCRCHLCLRPCEPAVE